jgi:AcrR family transcriptional regulator
MFGLRGASLRDIAKDAGVSLTLLDHHYGTKAMLLEAVVSSHRDACLKKIAPLRASLMALDGTLTLRRLVGEWVDYEFALSDTRQGRHDLHLMLRLAADVEVDSALRNDINCSERVVLDALRTLRPQLEDRQLRQAWVFASAALYASVLGIDDFHESGEELEIESYRADTKAFLCDGLDQRPSTA